MNHDLALSLELHEQSAERLVFRLRFLNRSATTLLLPYPEIHGLRFRNKRTMNEADWYTCLLQSSPWAGFTLAPGQSKTIEYRVRPKTAEVPTDEGNDFCRWRVDLPTGEYLVWFTLQVGEDYFCTVSHYTIEDLRWEADKLNAAAWMGEVKSKDVPIVHVARNGD